jgi:DNA polymerase III subunit gamma/tau
LASAAPVAINQPHAQERAQVHAQESAPPVRVLGSFAELVALATEKRDLTIKSALEGDVQLVRFEDGKLEIALDPSAPKTLVGELSKKLSSWTGRRWMVAISAEPGAPSLRAQAEARKAELKEDVQSDPLVQAVLKRFPGAEIVDVRPPPGAPTPEELPLAAPSDGDVADEIDDQ